MSRNILSGISDRQYRSTVQDLVSQGWSPRKTGGGHIKLIHPDAREPVFASCTPSCSRSSENLKAQARRALVKPADTEISSAFTVSLKGTASAVALGQATASFADQSKDVLPVSKKRKERWDKRRRQEAAAGKPLPAPSKATVAIDAKPAVSGAKPAVSPNPTLQPAAPAAMAEPLPAPVIAAVTEAPSVDVTPAVAVVETPAAPARPARKPVRRQAAAPVRTAEANLVAITQPAAPHAPLEIDAALLALALRIQSGEMQGLLITPEMVGKTLWFSGESAMTGRPAPAAPSVAAPRTAAAAAPTSVQDVWEGKRLEDEALLMRGIDDSYRALPDILARALPAGAEPLTESRKTVLRRRLKVMALDGRLDAVEGAKQGMTYRSVPV